MHVLAVAASEGDYLVVADGSRCVEPLGRVVLEVLHFGLAPQVLVQV